MTDRRDDAPQTPATQGFATAGAAADATNRDARAENPDAPAAAGDAGRTGDGHDGGPYGGDGPSTSLPGKDAARGGDVLAGAAAPLPRGLVGEILLPGSQAEQARQEAKVRRGFFPTLKRALRHIPFSQDVVASYYCALDPKTPPASRGILLAALAYFVLPIDVIPDFVAGLGFTDDMAVLLAAFSAVRNNIRPEHYDKARDVLKPEAEAPAGTGEAQGA